VTITSSAQSGGTYKLIGSDVVTTAAGGSIGPFRYIVLYNDTAASDDLIGYWDYGSAITLADTEAFTLDLALINRGGIFPGGSKGIGIALDTKIRWGGRS